MKCLIKSLDGIVDNPNLKKYDTLIVRIREVGNRTAIIPGCFCKLTGGYFSDSTYTEDNGTEGFKSGTVYMVITSNDATIELSDYSMASGTIDFHNNKYVVDINDALSNTDTRLTAALFGYDGTSSSGNGAVLKGSLADIIPYTQKLVLSGCTGAVRGATIDDIIINYANENNLKQLNIHATPIRLHTEALAGKYYLEILPSNTIIGELKYFADVVTTTLQISNTGWKYLTGSVEDYVQRVFANESELDPEIYPKRRTFRVRARTSMNITLGGVPVVSQIPADPFPTYVRFTWTDNYPIDGEITLTTE